MREDETAASVSRRGVFRLGLAGVVAAGVAPVPVWARPTKIFERSISLYHSHTDESAALVYWANGRYLPGPLAKINYLLRDFRTGEIKPIDTDLVDLLFALRLRLGVDAPVEVMSGYRSPLTNALLRRETSGVARNSMHLYGKAVDLRLRGVRPRDIARCARDMQRGGVGLYRGANFVHLDVGDVRTWGV